jgi:hypothetical protein
MTWTAKDPNEILDYSWPVPLDASDSIATHTAIVASGTVVIVSSEVQTNSIVVRVSGGAAGETALIKLTSDTAGGRVFEATFPLQIVDSDAESTFKAVFPSFADTPRYAVSYWQARAAQVITDDYGMDKAHATMLLTAHYLTMQGHGSDASAQRMGKFGGATRVKSGMLELAWDGGKDGFMATKYGEELWPIIRAHNIGGVTSTGTINSSLGFIYGYS